MASISEWLEIAVETQSVLRLNFKKCVFSEELISMDRKKLVDNKLIPCIPSYYALTFTFLYPYSGSETLENQCFSVHIIKRKA